MRPDTFSALHARPRSTCSRRPATASRSSRIPHEYHVVPDRSRYLEFEPHRVLDVYAHFPAAQDKVPVRPLYSASIGQISGAVEELFFTVRRLPRRRTVEEKAVRRRPRTIPAPTCSSRCWSPGNRAERSRPSNSACGRCAPTVISPSICRSARAAPTSACSTIPRSTWSASPVRPAARAGGVADCAAAARSPASASSPGG